MRTSERDLLILTVTRNRQIALVVNVTKHKLHRVQAATLVTDKNVNCYN